MDKRREAETEVRYLHQYPANRVYDRGPDKGKANISTAAAKT